MVSRHDLLNISSEKGQTINSVLDSLLSLRVASSAGNDLVMKPLSNLKGGHELLDYCLSPSTMRSCFGPGLF